MWRRRWRNDRTRRIGHTCEWCSALFAEFFILVVRFMALWTNEHTLSLYSTRVPHAVQKVASASSGEPHSVQKIVLAEASPAVEGVPQDMQNF